LFLLDFASFLFTDREFVDEEWTMTTPPG